MCNKQRPFTVKFVPLAQFVLFTLISCPPNILWQEFLEAKFPGYTTTLDAGVLSDVTQTLTQTEPILDKANTFRKLLFDQTLGAFVNTVAFVAGMAAFKGKTAKAVQRDVERDTVPLMINGWKVWPFVAFLNFMFVPVNRRVIVSSVVGLFWGVYLSLFASLD